MCGVNGIVAYHPSAPPIDRDELLRVRDAMRRRGPDGKGAWYSPDGRVGLGHRRLSIIDLSDAAAQPMVSANGRYVLSYNGEIYNYKTLRRQLLESGAALQTHSDTEVVLELLARDGVAALEQLRGMFALALWDRQERTVLLARDPFGIKPLYYEDDGWTLRFASQVRALREVVRGAGSPDPAGLAGFLLLGSVPEPHTLHSGTWCLPAGHYLRCGPGGAEAPVRWSREPAPPATRSDLKTALHRSVVAHLTADVAVGVFLSAGIDSTVLAALVKPHVEQLRTITVGFEEFRGSPADEVPLAAQVAAALNSEHQEHHYQQTDFDRDLPRVLEAMDQPSIDGFNTWIVAQACARAGMKAALSGAGADELFQGYPSFRDVPRWRRRVAPVGWIPGLGGVVRRLAGPLVEALGWSPKAAGMLEYGGSLSGAWLLKRGLFMPWELPRLLGPELAREGLKRLGLESRLASATRLAETPAGQVAALEQQFYLRNQLLRDADWAGMDHGVEIRLPYVDRVLQRELGAARYTKQDLFAVAAADLPGALGQRPKSGFGTPLGRWRGHPGPQWARGWAADLLAGLGPERDQFPVRG